MSVQSCMGGWCTKRDHCAHYHAATPEQTPSQRLCPPGHDGAGLQHLESEVIDMTRPYLSADERRQQALSVLRDGMSIAELRDALGYSKNENATRVMDTLVYAGQVFTARSKCDPESGSKAWTTLYFRTVEARDAHVKLKDDAIAARNKARKKATACRMPYYIKRNAERKAARQARIKQREAETAERKALRAAEAEIAKQRKRLDREARAAEIKREKAEARTQQQRLKAETKAAGQLGKQKGTSSPKAAPVRGPAMLDGELDLSRAKVTPIEGFPSRWDTSRAAPVISSADCRPWARAAASQGAQA